MVLAAILSDAQFPLSPRGVGYLRAKIALIL
jgi:hypothetical protein